MKKPFAIFFLLISLSGKSQVTIQKDARIDQLVKAEAAPLGPNGQPIMDGYRIQLAFDSDKKVVEEARSRFNSSFPKVDTYMEFKAPHYFLRVGDFRTQLEAEQVKAATANAFPTAFVVKDKINLPRIDQ